MSEQFTDEEVVVLKEIAAVAMNPFWQRLWEALKPILATRWFQAAALAAAVGAATWFTKPDVQVPGPKETIIQKELVPGPKETIIEHVPFSPGTVKSETPKEKAP